MLTNRDLAEGQQTYQTDSLLRIKQPTGILFKNP
jgi:hypothetical protein